MSFKPYYTTKTAQFVRRFKIKTLKAIVKEFNLKCPDLRNKDIICTTIENALEVGQISKSQIWIIAMKHN